MKGRFSTIKKSLLVAASALTVLAIGSGEAAASGVLKPGQYDLDGIQQICLKSDGTAYLTTYSFDQALNWYATGDTDVKDVIWGNVFDGFYTETISVSKNNNFNWVEQAVDGSYFNFLDQLPMTLVKKKCDPPPSRVPSSGHAVPATKE